MWGLLLFMSGMSWGDVEKIRENSEEKLARSGKASKFHSSEEKMNEKHQKYGLI